MEYTKIISYSYFTVLVLDGLIFTVGSTHILLVLIQFWIYAGNRVDDTGMLLLLLSRAYTEPSTASLVRKFWLHGRMGGDTARTGDPNWPKGYSRTCDIMLSMKVGGRRKK